MYADRTEILAERLTGQITDLSQSLTRAGVALAERARLLEIAAVAAMHAVCLEASSGHVREHPAPVTPIVEAPSLREVAAA